MGRRELLRRTCLVLGLAAACLLAPQAALATPAEGRAEARASWPRGVAVVGYRTASALRAALAAHPARIVRRIPALRAVEVRPRGSLARFAAALRARPGIAYVERVAPRLPAVEPALLQSPFRIGAYEWQYGATRADAVPEWAQRAASSVTIAVVDTGADLAAPDLAAKAPAGHNLRSGTSDVTDANGHGTFVASLAAGSATNGEGIAGFGGDARLLVIKAGSGEGTFTDVDEANAIVYAIAQGAKIINLSLGGPTTSATERRAIEYAASHGALVVAAVGNEFAEGNPVEYPAALLQPVGSNGRGGRGLAVAASTWTGTRASFSNTGSHVSLAAPGEGVFGALSSLSSPRAYPRVALPGSRAGFYGFGSGTSFAAPQVAGAAAVVWGANPALAADDVARILKESAQGRGTWTPELGFGVIDVARAVALATGAPAQAPEATRAAATITLAASRRSGRGRLRVHLTATLRPSVPTVRPAQREVTLETFARDGWTPAATATTGASGRVTWRVSLRRGTYRVRARYAGTHDLAAAESGPLALVVR